MNNYRMLAALGLGGILAFGSLAFYGYAADGILKGMVRPLMAAGFFWAVSLFVVMLMMPTQRSEKNDVDLGNPISNWWARRRRRIIRERLEGYLEYLKRQGISPKVVDLGCGKKKIIPSALGVDSEPSSDTDILTDLSDIIPLENDSADAVVMMEVIEHLVNPYQTLREVYRILKPNGRLYLTTPNYGVLWALVWVPWVHTFGRRWLGKHENNFNERMIRHLLTAFGFKLIDVFSVNFFLVGVEAIKPAT